MLRYDGGYRVYEAEADVFTDEDLLSFLDRVVAICEDIAVDGALPYPSMRSSAEGSMRVPTAKGGEADAVPKQ